MTSLVNLDSILQQGLLPRNRIDYFHDVANYEIIEFRDALDMNDYVLFHFFSKNPFDGRVQLDYREHEFDEGLQVIDWDVMESKDFANVYCKDVCLAECLAPRSIMPEEFYCIFVRNAEIETIVRNAARACGKVVQVTVNSNMFLKREVG